ncbi:hypothetical protein [Actinoplanes campanulatus]|uniref:hypothetical protein n=1 Tax=Actinoplanes campanulatus TaxID=113559 RepID=UPI001943F0C0|nr:hypothetical protein [Actinoplanes campanulatus]GID39677.1 hypothetical protein Aca09nite_61830 [Actinoplanes campanulatus]
MTATPLAAPPSTTPIAPAVPHTTAVDELRHLIRADPRGAVLTLQHGSDLDPAVTLILLAEAYQRLGEHREALTVAEQAVAAVSRADIHRLVAARAVLAGIACRIGGRAAVTPCDDYALLAARHGEPARVLLAGAVYAVATYNGSDGAQGRLGLYRLHQLAQHRDHCRHPVPATILTAYTAMNYICRHRRHPDKIPTPEAVLPGGLLDTDLTRVTPAALALLVRGTAVTHRCSTRRRR